MHTLESTAHAATLAQFLTLSPRAQVRAVSGESGRWRNTYGDTVSVDKVDPARPVAMYLTRRHRGVYRYVLVPLDLDAKHQADAQQAATDAELLAAAAAAEGIEPVPARSGPTGGRHVWLGCAEGVSSTVVQRIARAARVLAPSLDVAPLINPKSGAVRPPGAAHRFGGYSELTAHSADQAVTALGAASAPAEAFARLAVRLETMAAGRPVERRPEAAPEDATAAPVPPSIAARGPVVRPVEQDATGAPKIATPWRPLGERAVRSLRRNLTSRQNHSDWAHAPARAMALAGWTQAEGLAVALDPESSPALEWLRTERQADGTRAPRAPEQTTRLWARVWWLAVQDAARMPRRPQDDGASHERTDAERAVVDLFARMRAAGPRRWARASGPADAAVLAALAWLMLSAATTDVSANVRRLGVLAGYTHQTANLALWRLIRDGWLTVTAEADRRAGKARRVTLATAHECPDHDGHRCAIYDVSAGHAGSDRRRNAAAPYGPLGVPTTDAPAYLRALITHQQADVWHDLGHHAARTLQAVRDLPRPTLRALAAATGYNTRTTAGHLQDLQGLRLVTAESHRGRTVFKAASRPLHEAAQETGAAGRLAALAVQARVDHERHVWWTAEEEWSALPRQEKRARGLRPGPDQQVIPSMASGARAYPRRPDGRPDHAAARRIEAERIGAAGMLAHAQQLAQAGDLIDPAHLSATGADQPKRGPRRGPVLPARHRCPHCHAAPGERCVTWRGELTARWHTARRTAAEETAEVTRRQHRRSA
ncbi:hypothetical protein [Streptomyces sp. NRRL WC-3742]|uniref:zinc finger domain-containing protein n=1 Tax=Streptomyces sp. NRRL WC-3742 TaxID=1463934 RepID=UPI00131B2B7E|nr:hypothetical protein [Streptomyces sp. NRRL WC-3742]